MAVAGPSRPIGRILPQFSEREMDILDALKMGLGVSQNQMDLFEQCDHCGQSFMRSALRVHIKEVGETNQATVTSDVEVVEG